MTKEISEEFKKSFTVEKNILIVKEKNLDKTHLTIREEISEKMSYHVTKLVACF